MGLTPVPSDRLATVVTTLEMRERPRPRPLPSSTLRLVRWRTPAADRYRALFRRVGERWLWYSRLTLDDAALAARLAVAEVYAVADPAGVELGMLELDFSAPEMTQITYFGLVPELTGQGHGRWLMGHALALAWRPGTARVQLNTCTLDHPSALPFYRAQGFVAVGRTIETFPDPRALGLLPEDAAPQVPYLANRR